MQQGMVVLPGMVSFLGAEPVRAKPDTWTSARVCVMYDAINSVAQRHRYTILTAGECLKPTKPTPGTLLHGQVHIRSGWRGQAEASTMKQALKLVGRSSLPQHHYPR